MINTSAVANGLWRYRFLLLAISVCVTLPALSGLTSMAVSNSLEIWYPGDDPALRAYREFETRYGNDELVVVAVRSESGFAGNATADRLSELTDRLFLIDGIASVTSLTTIGDHLPVAGQRLLSDDGRTAGLIVQLASRDSTEEIRGQMINSIRAAGMVLGFETRLAGYGVIYEALNHASTHGSVMLVLIAYGLMLLLLALFFRNVLAVVGTLLTIITAMVWTMGAYALFGNALNMVTMALPTLVLVMAAADCVHVVRAVDRQSQDIGQSKRVVEGIRTVVGPCLLTSVTTATGFLALSLSDLPIIRQLGVYGAVGMLSAFCGTFCVMPALLGLAAKGRQKRRSTIRQIAVSFSRFGIRYPRSSIGIFAILIAIALPGLHIIETDTYSLGYLDEDHPVRLDSAYIERTIGPYAPIDYVIGADDVFDPMVLQSLRAWQDAAVELDEVVWSWSILDATGGSEAAPHTRTSHGDVATEVTRLRVLVPELVTSSVFADRELRVSFGAPMMSARRMQALRAAIEKRADFPDGVVVQPAGYSALYASIVERIVAAQIRGFASALIIIIVLIGVATRSLMRAILAIPANLFPVGMTLGLMGWMSVPLDLATATIATVILGLVVDDSIHILAERRAAKRSLARSTGRAISRRGDALMTTTIILAAGFMVLGLADIRSIAWFGLFASFALIVALLTDLILLPAIATLLSKRHNTPGWRAQVLPVRG